MLEADRGIDASSYHNHGQGAKTLIVLEGKQEAHRDMLNLLELVLVILGKIVAIYLATVTNSAAVDSADLTSQAWRYSYAPHSRYRETSLVTVAADRRAC